MKQVFYGCERYANFLKAANHIIFTRFAGSTNRKNDSTVFSIFTYLICFRMDQLPLEEFKKIVLSQDMVRMNVVLSFLFDFQNLRANAFPVLQEHLELEYLENKLLPKLQERKGKIPCLGHNETIINQVNNIWQRGTVNRTSSIKI